jgi:hypothetical protein
MSSSDVRSTLSSFHAVDSSSWNSTPSMYNENFAIHVLPVKKDGNITNEMWWPRFSAAAFANEGTTNGNSSDFCTR